MKIEVSLEKILDDTYCKEKNKEILSSLNKDEIYDELCNLASILIKPFDNESYQEFMELIANESYYKEIERNDIFLIRDVYFWMKFAKNPL